MAAQDIASNKAFGDVTADLLTHLGVKVDYVAVDWGTIVARRTQKSAPDKAGGTLSRIRLPAWTALIPHPSFFARTAIRHSRVAEYSGRRSRGRILV